MKKPFSLILSLALSASIAGCAADSGARNTADSFLNALETGDLDGAIAVSDGTAREGVEALKASTLAIFQFPEGFEISDEMQAVMDEFVRGSTAISYKSHKIWNMKRISDDEYEVTAIVTIADSQSLADAIAAVDPQSDINTYADEINEITLNEGEDAGFARMMYVIYDCYNRNMDEIESHLRFEDGSIKMTLKKNKDGTWMVSDIPTDSQSD